MALIYVVDKDPHVCDTVQIMLESEEWDVQTFDSAEDFFRQFNAIKSDIVITDYHLQGVTGLEIMEKVHAASPEIEVVIITETGDEQTALNTMKAGAYDYIKKPLNIQELRVVVERALHSKKIGDKLSYMYNQQRKMFGFGELIGSSHEMQRVFKIIRMVSESKDTPVVIVGETGTGKELAARSIHANGTRNTEPFVEVNCGAIQENLLESELFGHEQGAFTDARKSKRGLMEVASGGTFFLDEIASMDLSLQVKLLKAIEEKKIRRVGGVKDISIDIRVLAATSRPLEDLIAEGKFREDLYYRLNVISIEMPPLRNRGEDIKLLTHHFIDQFNEEFKYRVTGISDAAEHLLIQHDWPGNVRELRNVIERAVLLKKSGVIDTHHLFLVPSSLGKPAPSDDQEKRSNGVYIPEEGIDLESKETELTRRYIEAALEKTDGNKSQAARLLGISRGSLRYRMEKMINP
ncbi:MAG: sigma-54 dependent transcriptional regulator [Candidatus Marinimicrobia bacterium]|nr:sigma-54 dependent transcriptional regulator [Candidatus Neomarinimicrobiota bacterium]MCF7829113.1 sigma-54 dependent transcriptional regulator [Candidatus Neomarinimicrobiota bacterium]MCF7881488.1 sigma-54 dependent transcriptional regulator [Candidatus Neomarinimicrobiota bacterium]